MYAIKDYVYSGSTSYQQVDIVDTYTFGRSLILDGKVQSSKFDEHIYHEALIHPAVVLHGRPRNALIMGGGEGAVLRELCKYPFIEKIVMVDIDEAVVNLCRTYLPEWHNGAFEDKRVQVLHMDARRYLEETDERFDLIYSDLTEPFEEGPSYLLFTRQFYTLVKNKLTDKGLLTVQAGGIGLDYIRIHAAIRNTLQNCFAYARSYHTFIPSFDSSWGFVIASGAAVLESPGAGEIDRFLAGLGSSFKFYDGETHTGMFCLPKDVRELLAKEQNILDDAHPLTVY